MKTSLLLFCFTRELKKMTSSAGTATKRSCHGLYLKSAIYISANILSASAATMIKLCFLLYHTELRTNNVIKDNGTADINIIQYVEPSIQKITKSKKDLKEKILILEDKLNDIVIEFIKEFLINQLEKDIDSAINSKEKLFDENNMLKEKLMEDLKNSMKEKNNLRKNVIQMVRAAILQIEKDKGIVVEDEKILEIIAKEIKGKKDAIIDFQKAGREDLINQTNIEIEVLQKYLPKQLSKEEIKEKAMGIVARLGATSMKDMGNVMKEAKSEIGTAADGKSINDVVKEILG